MPKIRKCLKKEGKKGRKAILYGKKRKIIEVQTGRV